MWGYRWQNSPLDCRTLAYPQLFPHFDLRGDVAHGLVQEGWTNLPRISD